MNKELAEINELIESFTAELSPYFLRNREEFSLFMDENLRLYLCRQSEKSSRIKTLIYRNDPVHLYDVYVPVKLRLEGNKLSTDSAQKLFSKTTYLTVIGEAGSGKSTLVRHLFLSVLREKFSIPVLIELRNLNLTKKSVKIYLTENLFLLATGQKLLDKLLQLGKFTFFLDGYDELKTDAKSRVVKDLDNFIARYSRNKFLMTSRPYSNSELLPRLYNFRIEKFERHEIRLFIQKQIKDEVFTQRVMEVIEKSGEDYIKSYLANPLLLSMYLITFQRFSDIPDKKSVFYRRVLNTLFFEHDSFNKQGYQRERLSKLTQEEFEEILKRFSLLSFFENVFNFTPDYIAVKLEEIKKLLPYIKFETQDFIDDLIKGISIWVEDSGVISFSHRSLQEYFAASFIVGLNDFQKRKMYKKIDTKLEKNGKWEIENFLSLCEEMDKVSYYTYLILPLLKHLQETVDTTSLRTKLQSFLILFYDNSIIVNKTEIVHMVQPIPTPDASKYFLAIKEKEGLLISSFYDFFNNPDFLAFLNAKADERKNFFQFIISKLSDNEFWEILENSPLAQVVQEVTAFIEQKLMELDAFVSGSSQADSNIIELI